MVLSQEDGLKTPNAHGELPLFGLDPTRPNQAYFAPVDWVVEQAATRGLRLGFSEVGTFMGNSFASNATAFLPQLAEKDGPWLELSGAKIGGCSLQKHCQLHEAGAVIRV